MDRKDTPPTVVDLFCGAGGLSLGFRRAGFDVIHAVDSWQPAVETHRANLGAHAFQTGITESMPIPDCVVLIGGPPCQGFSSAGKRQQDDHRNSLVSVFARLVARHKPLAFVFENVEGFLTGGKGQFIFHLLEPVIAAGYRVRLHKVNAANYGVPQHRKRVVAIGGLGWEPSFPTPTHAAFGAPGAHLGNGHKAVPTPTFEMALGALPTASPQSPGQVPDHVFTPLDGDDLRRAEMLQPGQRMRDLPEELWHKSYKKRAFRRVMDGMPTEKRGGAPSGILRLRANEPSKAITGGALRDFLHPTENRLLTLRECAVLQTFAPDFVFLGSQADKMQLIGNAVPPLLAEAIACSLYRDILEVPHASGRPGALLSFLPTLSAGMSPVLDNVTQRVKARFLRHGKQDHQALLWD